jgi:hypothetical protein
MQVRVLLLDNAGRQWPHRRRRIGSPAPPLVIKPDRYNATASALHSGRTVLVHRRVPGLLISKIRGNSRRRPWRPSPRFQPACTPSVSHRGLGLRLLGAGGYLRTAQA